MNPRFRVARNPDPGSRLPYLLWLPIEGGVVLKAREAWPRAARVFCTQDATLWNEGGVVDHAAVLVCRRRGAAIDLILDRPDRARSEYLPTAADQSASQPVKGTIPSTRFDARQTLSHRCPPACCCDRGASMVASETIPSIGQERLEIAIRLPVRGSSASPWSSRGEHPSVVGIKLKVVPPLPRGRPSATSNATRVNVTDSEAVIR
jgi:hypothetical protein